MSLTNATSLAAAQAAKQASRITALLSNEARNSALTAIHDALTAAKDYILQANADDLQEAAQAVQDSQLSTSMLNRLDLRRPGKFEEMLQGIINVRDLADPRKDHSHMEYPQRQVSNISSHCF